MEALIDQKFVRASYTIGGTDTPSFTVSLVLLVKS